MSKRPHIPLRVQLDAALFQLGLDPRKAELDHDPALQLRAYDEATGKYNPDANNPRFLVWRSAESHAQKTFKDNGTGRGDLTAMAVSRKVRTAHELHQARMAAKEAGKSARPPARWAPRKSLQRRSG